jgi:uncharacterized protein
MGKNNPANNEKEINKDNSKNKKGNLNDKIQELETQISKTKYNKKTQHAIGIMKAQLAALRDKSANSGKGQKKGDGYSVKKSGDATVVLLGFPSVGKSTLLNTLTNANSEVGAYAFTTLTCIPGTLLYKGAKIQILDVPGIVEGAARGSGRGKEVLQVIRNADLIVVLLDVFHPEHYKKILQEVFEAGVRINQEKADIKVTKTIKGGIDVGYTVGLTKMNKQTVISMMKALGYVNVSVVIREDINEDQLIDAVEGNKAYVPAITVLNKIDIANTEQINNVEKLIGKIDVKISANEKEHIEELKEKIFENLKFLRIYLKEIGKKPDLEEPLIIQNPCSLEILCRKLHKDFITKFKFARIWGKSVKFDGQKIVKLKHLLSDEDIVELHIR